MQISRVVLHARCSIVKFYLQVCRTMVSFWLILYRDQTFHSERSSFAVAMPSTIIVLGPLGIFFRIVSLSLQPPNDRDLRSDMMAFQSQFQIEDKSSSFALSKSTVGIPFSGFAFFLLMPTVPVQIITRYTHHDLPLRCQNCLHSIQRLCFQFPLFVLNALVKISVTQIGMCSSCGKHAYLVLY